MTSVAPGWMRCTLGDIAVLSSGFGFPEQFQGKTAGKYPFAKVRDISASVAQDGGLLTRANHWVDETDLIEIRAKPVPKGSIVFAKIGEAIRLNRRAQVDQPTVIDNNCMALTPSAALPDPRYLLLFMQTIDLSPFAVATTVPSVRRGDVEAIPFDLPPANEQRRIVAKLDRLSARSRTARDHLARTAKLAARAKQAILAAAFRGELTAEWREANGGGEAPQVALASVCLSLTDGDHQAPPKSESGVPFITISAINDGRLRLERATRYVPASYREALKPSRRAERGDILFSVTGSIAIPALVDTDEPFVFQRHIAILKPDASRVVTEFLLFMLGADQIKQQAYGVATGTAQLTIPLGGLRAFRIPLPSFPEQCEIVHRIESAFAGIDRLTAEAARAAHLLDRLDDRLLAKAFRGELVPQDPADEPAEALLGRIRAARAGAPRPRRGRRPRAS
jgi:type I restriction enzyme S subunit